MAIAFYLYVFLIVNQYKMSQCAYLHIGSFSNY